MTQGINPNQFNTAAVAQDVVELIQALSAIKALIFTVFLIVPDWP